MAALLGCAGYMEYYVQRHGNQAALAYSVMSVALCGYLVLVLVARATAGKEMQSAQQDALCSAEVFGAGLAGNNPV